MHSVPTVFVMPSVKRTKSIVSCESRQSGRRARMRVSAEAVELVLSYEPGMVRSES